MREIGERDKFVAKLTADLSDFLVRTFEEFIEQAEFVDDFEGRRMNRVAAKITKEVSVLLEDDDLDAGPRQQETQHDSGRAAAGNAATCLNSPGHL